MKEGMTSKKNNQAKDFFSFKDDDFDLVELGQFIRDTTKYRVEREWHILFNSNSGNFMGYYKTIPENPKYNSRNPDLILINKKTKGIELIIELDGDIHRIKETDTDERNEQYEKAGIPLLVINKWEMNTSIYDYVNKKLEEGGYI